MVQTAETAGTERWLRPALAILALSQIGAGLWEAVSPSSFYRLAHMGPFNQHFIHDLSTMYVAFGVGLLVSIRRPAWRVPVLAVATVQYALHFVSHLVDIGKGHPGWVGPVNAALVGLGLAGFAALLTVCWRRGPG